MGINATYDNIAERIGEKTLDKITKLLTRAKDTAANENEANVAMGFALDLLAKHNLSVSDVDGVRKEETVDSCELDRSTKSKLAWETSLIRCICDTHFCFHYTCGKKSIIVGKETNKKAVKMLYLYLVSVINDMADKAFEDYKGFEHGKTYKNSFKKGMVERISDRLEEQKRQIIQEVKGNRDLVRVDPYEKAAEENANWLSGQGINLTYRTKYIRSGFSGAGYNKGLISGNAVGLQSGGSLPGRR